jgi:hypothetical protein
MITQPMRELINRAKADELGFTADYSPLESLVAPILDYGNHEARSLILFLQVMIEVAKKAKPATTVEVLTAAIDYAFAQSRDGKLAVMAYLHNPEGGP